VTKIEDDGSLRFLPRSIDDTPLDTEEDEVAGYLCPVTPSEPDRVYRRRWSSSLSGYFSRELCVVKVPFCGCG
jgi:hypothetical protein